jgi:hypothetical protein
MPAKVKVTPRRFPPPWSVEERGLMDWRYRRRNVPKGREAGAGPH